MTYGSARPGFAVATAVFALVVIGALALGTLFAATHELRAGSEAMQQARATMAADLGVESAIAAWQRPWNGALARGYGRTWAQSTAEGVDLTMSVTRLADELFVVAADARVGPARREVAKVVRLDASDPSLLAAVTSIHPVDVSQAMGSDGVDRVPVGWDCPAPGLAVPVVSVTDTSTLLRFGQLDWSTLAALANAHVGGRVTGVTPRVTDEECDIADPMNWGEPHKSNGGSCTSYYPVIHASTDLVVDGGRGEGTLIVDGNLTLQGAFEFFGAVLVRGALIGGPGGARITGAVSIAGPASTLDGITIQFSRCAARKALLTVASPAPIVDWSWSERFPDR
jgi:uncharacterized protein YukE